MQQAFPFKKTRQILISLIALNAVFAAGFLGFSVYFSGVVRTLHKNEAKAALTRVSFGDKVNAETRPEKLRFQVIEERSSAERQMSSHLNTLGAFNDIAMGVGMIMLMTIFLAGFALRQMRPPPEPAALS